MTQHSPIDIERELEQRCAVADAKLGVAEDLGWYVAGFAAIAAYLQWHSWLISIAVVIGIYMLATHWYKKEHAVAWDALGRATGTGKYYRPREPNDAL